MSVVSSSGFRVRFCDFCGSCDVAAASLWIAMDPPIGQAATANPPPSTGGASQLSWAGMGNISYQAVMGNEAFAASVARFFGISVENLRSLVIQFMNFDEDRSGSISPEEVSRLCARLELHISAEERDAMFKEADRDQDGAINLTEFIAMAVDLRKQRGSDATGSVFSKVTSSVTNVLDGLSVVALGVINRPLLSGRATDARADEHQAQDADATALSSPQFQTRPFRCRIVDGMGVHIVEAGRGFFAALTVANEVKVFGGPFGVVREQRVDPHPQTGFVGFSSLKKMYQSQPPLLTFRLPTANETIATIACGDLHLLALSGSGVTYAVGLGSHGQLGKDLTVSRMAMDPVAATETATAFKRIAAAGNVSFALTADGRLFGWGESLAGSLGCEASDAEALSVISEAPAGAVAPPSASICIVRRPREIRFPPPGSGLPSRSPTVEIQSISAGPFHFAAIDSAGILYTWGCGRNGQLGHGATLRCSQNAPRAVEYFRDRNMPVAQVACGHSHTLVLTRRNLLFAFGMGCCGELGHGKLRDEVDPIEIPIEGVTGGVPLAQKRGVVRRIACGGHMSCISTDDGRMYIWGLVGAGVEQPQAVPLPLLVADLFGVSRISCGWQQIAVLCNQARRTLTANAGATAIEKNAATVATGTDILGSPQKGPPPVLGDDGRPEPRPRPSLVMAGSPVQALRAGRS